MKGTFLVVVALLCSLPLLAIPLQVSGGEQPPLFSSSGGFVDTAIARALALEGYEVSYTWYPIGRMLALLEANELDFYITPSNTPGQANPHVLLFEARGVFFFKRSRFASFPATRLEDFAGKRVATVVNSPLRTAFERAGIVVDEGPIETMFSKLDAGRVDFVATADVGGILAIKAAFPGREAEFGLSDFAYSRIGAGLYAKPGPESERVLAALKRGFARMRADASLEALLIAYFGRDHWRRVVLLE